MFVKQTKRQLRSGLLRCEPLEARLTLSADLTFMEPMNFRGTGTWPREIGAANLNGDEHLDLLVHNGGPDWSTSILLGTGGGQFTPVRGQLRTDSYSLPAVADLDGDGDLDLVADGLIATGDNTVIRVLLNNGHASFTPAGTFDAGGATRRVVSGDLDNDDDFDLVAVHRGGGDVSVLLNAGDGTFGSPESYFLGNNSKPDAISVGDLNGDGSLDLVVVKGCSEIGPCVAVLMGIGDGTFGEPSEFDVEADSGRLALGDFNGDSDLDLAAANYARSHVSVLLGIGGGAFDDWVTYSMGLTIQSASLTSGDFDGDGHLDLATLKEGHPGQVLVLPGNGDGTFGNVEEFDTGRDWTRGITAADLDGDGDLDLAVANLSPSAGVEILLNTTEPTNVPPPTEPVVGDANADGIFDWFDIVQVLQTGKYRSGKPATFGEGDWNNDGVFDQLDIVEALSLGDYSRV